MGFYDGFEADSLNANYFTIGTITPTIQTSPAPPAGLGTKMLRLVRTGGGGETANHGAYRNDIPVGPPVTFIWYFAKTGSYWHCGMCFGIQSTPATSFGVHVGRNSSSAWCRISKFTGTFGYVAANVLVNNATIAATMNTYLGTTGNWIKCVVDWTTTSITATFYKMDGTSIGSVTVNNSTYGEGGWGFFANNPMIFNSATTQYFDAEVLNLNTTPTITVTNITKSKISAQDGMNVCTVTFQSDQDLQAWEARADGSGLGQGDLVGEGSTVSANTDITFDVYYNELTWGDKAYRINVYGQNLNGDWNEYEA